MDEVRDERPTKQGSAAQRSPLGIPREVLASRLVPGKSVLLEELRDVDGVRSKYIATSASAKRPGGWARTLVPGYVVTPTVANMRGTGSQAHGDLWLTLVETKEK